MNRDEQVRRNLVLAQAYFGRLLDHPDELDDLPDGTHVILVPSDDPELVDANLGLAREVLAAPRDEDVVPAAADRTRDTARGVYVQAVGSSDASAGP